MVVFAVHNVLNDPPFSGMDLIACRNLMIFLENQAQKNVLGRFHFALRPGGLLFIGGAETVSADSELFEAVAKQFRVYRRIGRSRPELLSFASPGGCARATAPGCGWWPSPATGRWRTRRTSITTC